MSRGTIPMSAVKFRQPVIVRLSFWQRLKRIRVAIKAIFG
jgi:hypothetical protein